MSKDQGTAAPLALTFASSQLSFTDTLYELLFSRTLLGRGVVFQVS